MPFDYDRWLNNNDDYCKYCGIYQDDKELEPRFDKILKCDSSWDAAHYLLSLYCKKTKQVECPHKCEFCLTEIMKYLDEEI